MKKFLAVFFSFLLADTIFFWPLWNIYFQQDEWYGFANIIIASSKNIYAPLLSVDLHYVPLDYIARFATFRVFGLHAEYYAVLALILHTLAVTLAYIFFKNITKKELPSFLMAFLLLISYPAKQSVVWFGVTVISLLPSFIFFFLFFVLLERFKGKLNIKKTVFLLLIFLGSVMFKEDALIIIPLFPAYIYLFWRDQDKKQLEKYAAFLISAMVGYFLLTLFVHIIAIQSNPGLRMEKQGSIKTITLYNSIFTPFLMVNQGIIEYEDIFKVAVQYTSFAFPKFYGNGPVILSTIYQNIILFLSIPLVFLVGYSFAHSGKFNKKYFIFSTLWIVVYSVLLSVQTRRFEQLESRYLFFGDVGVFLLVYAIIASFWNKKILNTFVIIFLSTLLFIIFTVYYFLGDKDSMRDFYLFNANQRKEIISEITKIHPSIQKDTVFYVTCKDPHNCYDRILPFQSSVGQMLMVIYSPGREKGYAPLLEDTYLYDFASQGYKKVGDYGFGYFMDFQTLANSVRIDKIPVDKIIALSYDKSSNKVKNISFDTQRKLLQINSVNQKQF